MMKKREWLTRFCVWSATTVLCVLFFPAQAFGISYLKTDDTIFMKDGTEIVGTVIFRAPNLVVVMVGGEEMHIEGNSILRVEISKVITGEVESTNKPEIEPEKTEPAEEPTEPAAEEPAAEKKEPAAEEPAKPAEEKELTAEDKPAEEPDEQKKD